MYDYDNLKDSLMAAIRAYPDAADMLTLDEEGLIALYAQVEHDLAEHPENTSAEDFCTGRVENEYVLLDILAALIGGDLSAEDFC